MSDSNPDLTSERPIERGFPIEQVTELATREGRAKLYYRPLTTMHKWWAGKLGSTFRAICLYTLLDDPDRVTVEDDIDGNTSLSAFTPGDDDSRCDLSELIQAVDLENPDALWDLYHRDVQVEDVNVLDPFMGGGTSLLEACRFDASVTGVDLNPVAWFVTKKEFEAHEVKVDALQSAFERVENEVAAELTSQYETDCPHDGEHFADIVYALWVRTLDCISCGETIPLFKDYRVAKGRYADSDRYHVVCPDCGGISLTDDLSTNSVCSECSNEFVPENGPVSQGGKYGCPSCGLKYPIVDAIADGQSYSEELFAIEYYCTDCDDEGKDRSVYKGFKKPSPADRERYESASDQWETDETLQEYAPEGSIPEGAITAASRISGNDIFRHGFQNWRDMFNDRQLYCLSTLLRAIDDIDDQQIKEYLLLAFSDSLLFQNSFGRYNSAGRKIEGILGRNSYTPRGTYAENNVWGTRAGRGTFTSTWEKIINGVEFAHDPTERYVKDGELEETESFDKSVSGDYTLHQGDMRDVNLDTEYDAIITDPPYYENVIYSEVSDFFYVWQHLLLSNEYDCFEEETTPRQESIVSNPAIGKDDEQFELELGEAFSRMREVLSDDGILAFTYQHGEAESWGPLLDGLCGSGFDVAAMYPVSANASELFGDDKLNFTVVVIAKPADTREPISWASLRRQAHHSATEARKQIEKSDQSVSEGEMGIVELGRCFREYSQYYGKVHREGGVLDSTEIAAEMHGLVAGDVTPDDIYLTLLGMDEPTQTELHRLCYGTEVSPEEVREKGLIRDEGEFEILDWNDEDRVAYLKSTAESDLTALDRVQLRRWYTSQTGEIASQQHEIEETNEMIELIEDLAALTNDEGYRSLLHD